MKVRNLLMGAAFIMAVGSTLAFKSESKKSKSYMSFSYFAGGHCYSGYDETDQTYCEDFFTGAQCTYYSQPIYVYDIEGPLPPSCSVPLRRFN